MKIVVFAGTSEGKAASSLLARHGHELFVTVATEYGRCVFEESLTQKNIRLLEGRLSIGQMKELIAQAVLVVDATHPYAVEVSKNIVLACEEVGRSYLRIVRASEDSSIYEDVILWAENQDEAIALMNESEERVLLTTGSKDLPKYTQVKDYKERLFPRILPDMVSLQIAMDNDYKKKNIICMQGPFTHEANASMLEMIGAGLLLTKETGASGGYYEKLSACRAAGAKAIVIRRPQEEMDKERVRKILMDSATMDELELFLIERQGKDFTLEDMTDFLKRERGRKETQASEDIKRAMEENTHKNPPRFPIFLDLAGKRVTVIGSGNIARRRIAVLLDYGATVRVISPNASNNLQMAGLLDWENDPSPELRGRLEVIDRAYQKGDLTDSVIAVAATDNREVNRQIYEEARELGIFVSVADKKDESSYFFPAIWHGENLSVGIVGDGSDHRYVRKSAEEIRRKLGEIDWKRLKGKSESIP